MAWPDSALDPALKVSRPDPYVYKSPLKRAAARVLDFGADIWLAPPAPPIAWNKIRRVALLRLDHLGDVINAFPAFAALRKALPEAELDLYVGPWGKDIAGLGAAVDHVVVAQASWFQRPQRVNWPWGEIRALGMQLAAGNYDMAVELRGDLRQLLALELSGTPARLGHAITAGRAFLTHPTAYDNTLHEIDQNLAPFRQYGLQGLPELGTARPRLKLPRWAVGEAAAVAKRLKLKPGFISVQAACGTEAKRWLPERWQALLQSLPAKNEVVFLGAAHEAAEMKALAARFKKRRPKLATGMLSLGGLAAFLKMSKLLISVDSGPAHMGAAVGIPVLGLYSGTNLLGQWGLRGPKTRMLQAVVPCAPCELTRCPYDNECMRRLGVDEALGQALDLL